MACELGHTAVSMVRLRKLTHLDHEMEQLNVCNARFQLQGESKECMEGGRGGMLLDEWHHPLAS